MKNITVFVVIGVIAIASLGYVLVSQQKSDTQIQKVQQKNPPSTETPPALAAITQKQGTEYLNTTYHYSFVVPNGWGAATDASSSVYVASHDIAQKIITLFTQKQPASIYRQEEIDLMFSAVEIAAKYRDTPFDLSIFAGATAARPTDTYEVLQAGGGTEVGYQYRTADQKPIAARINLKTRGSLDGGMAANTLFIRFPLEKQYNLSNEETRNFLRTFKVE